MFGVVTGKNNDANCIKPIEILMLLKLLKLDYGYLVIFYPLHAYASIKPVRINQRDY